MSGYFKCIVHHGGNFIKTGDHYRYEGNESLWDCIEDKWSYFEVLWLLRKLNYPKGAVLWYDDGGADSRVGYKEFNDDKGALDIVEIAGRKGMVYLYVRHPVSEAEVIYFLPSCFKDNPISDEHVDGDEESPEPVVNQTGDHEVPGNQQNELPSEEPQPSNEQFQQPSEKLPVYGPRKRMGCPKGTSTNLKMQRVKQTAKVWLSCKHGAEEETNDASKNLFIDSEEETNYAEEFDGEFVNLEGASRRCHLKRKRGRLVDGVNSSDFEYKSDELESGPESDEDGDVLQFVNAC